MLKTLAADLVERLRWVSLRFSMHQSLVSDLPDIQDWDVTAVESNWDDMDESGNPKQEEIARINIVKGDLLASSLWQQLDAMKADLEIVASSLLDDSDSDLRPEIEELLAGGGSKILILNSVQLSPAWRGYGVGVLLAGEAIEALAGDTHCIATYPAPLSDLHGKERDQAIRKLQRTWAQLGFRQFDDHVWILDPGLVHLQDALSRLRSNFRLES